MSYIIPSLSLLIAIFLGIILTKKLNFLPKFSTPFYAISLGLISFTAINYFFALIFSFSKGIIFAQLLILTFEIFYFIYYKISFNFIPILYSILKEKFLFALVIIIGTILFLFFNHHIIPDIDGDLYTGESTYGDLPFHLSTISQITYVQKLPPDNPMYAGTSLVYPYLINFFSAILVYEGWSFRFSIIIPGLILSIALIGLIYDFAYTLTRNGLKSFLAVLIYFFNGGLGFYFFLKDYSFNLNLIINALSDPTSLKEYSHLFEQNIQWANFISRMVVPERSLLFGIPAGIIILRLLFFNDKDTNKKNSLFDLAIAAFLISLMPLLHTHTVLAFIVILPVIALFTLNKQWKKRFTGYAIVTVLAVILAIFHIPLFLTHISQSESFFKFHVGWMTSINESFFWFWFKNTYLLIPLTLIVLVTPMITKSIKILQVCTIIILIIINLALFSPYNWDNVKFLFWGGLFYAVGSASLLGHIFQTKGYFLKTIIIIIIFTMISSALLSIWREIHVKYVLFSKEAVEIGKKLQENTPPNSIFLTYKIHNSPVNNLAGRSILMGYPGLVWVHGINYQNREKDIEDIFAGLPQAKKLISKYGIDYAVIEPNSSEKMYINQTFFNQYPVIFQSKNYIIYKLNE